MALELEEPCGWCGGKGRALNYTHEETCPRCKGTGKVLTEDGVQVQALIDRAIRIEREFLDNRRYVSGGAGRRMVEGLGGAMKEEIDFDDLTQYNDDGLVRALAFYQDEIQSARTNAGRVEQEITARLVARHGTQMAGSDGTVAKLVAESPSYDPTVLRALLEELSEDWNAKVYRAPYIEQVTRPERWDGTQLRAAERALGGKTAAIIQAARVPGRQRLVLEERSKP